MKFNWGTGIAAFIVVACSMFVYVGISSIGHAVHMTEKDYYSQEAGLNAKMEKTRNAALPGKGVSAVLSDDGHRLLVSFGPGNQGPAGKIRFFRPADPALDFELAISLNPQHVQEVPLDKVASGLWLLQFDWQDGGSGYYAEQKLVVP